MKIAISGAHSTGKTTLVNALKKSNKLKNFTFRTNLTRSLKESGIPINELGTATTQLYVMTKHFEFLNTPGHAVLDRCALDGLAYTMYFYDKIDERMQTVFERLFEQMIVGYDAICYIEPELEIVNDGTRSVNIDFYNKVVENFEILIEECRLPVHRISGTVEERTKKVLKIISNIKKDKTVGYEL